MFGRALTVEERQDLPRVPLSAPVEVHIPCGVRRGAIVELSRSGVGVQIDKPPAVGTPALVKWDDQEAMGQVIWERGTSCGIRFDRPLADRLFEAAVSGTRRERPASVSKMQIGERRRAPWKRVT